MKKYFGNSNCSTWVLFAFMVVVFPIFVNWIMTVSCSWAIGNVNTWIGFWGAYIGGIASFGMALIAYKQMRVISEQNRPFLYPTIDIFSYRDFGENHFDYCLHIVNHGSRIASNVHVEIDGEILDRIDKKYSDNLSIIRNREYVIPEKDDVVLKICPELSRETFNDKDYSSWLNEFKQSSVKVRLSYNNEYTIEKTISLSNTLYAKTSSLQMLFYMKQSIDNLNETLKTGKNKDNKTEKV